MNEVESTLLETFAEQAAAVPPPVGVYPAVRRRHRRRRMALIGSTVMVVVLAVLVPTAAVRLLAPAPVGPAVPRTVGCVGGTYPAASGLTEQTAVAGSLGGDREAVTAVLRAGWAGLDRRPDGKPPAQPQALRVPMVQRAEDGWVIGLVTVGEGTDPRNAVLVAGPDVEHLTPLPSVMSDPEVPSSGSSEYAAGAYAGFVAGCGPRRLVVAAPAGSRATVTWTAGIAADATPDVRTVPVPLRADGVGVLTAPSPDATLTLRVHDGRGRTLATSVLQRRPGSLPGLDRAALTRSVAAAPGDGDPAVALSIVQAQYSVLPERETDVRVLWRGRAAGQVVAVAADTLAGGAHYLWGGSSSGDGTVYPIDGLVGADELDRTAFVFPLPGQKAVFFTGTRQVRIGARTETVTGGLVVRADVPVTVLGTSRQVDARSGLIPVPGPKA